ncbi:Major intrinsic protein [Trema orientale]|uniref:Major intrinsic protein n=1 Tax=Trema orientale TaxID=63057 RepID=A0A2P5ERD1_TREOI|nr:Major intrinsic protein [Trema orientale]
MAGLNCVGAASNVSLVRKLGAEFVGTFIMVFGAAAAPIVNEKHDGSAGGLVGNAACAGLAVMVVIFSTGHISGAHLNPAVTIAFAAVRHFPWAQVLPYIVVQVSASLSASFVLKAAFHPYMSGGVTVPTVNDHQAFALEFVVTFILMFIVTAVATDSRAVGELAGIAVGATVILNSLVAGTATGGSMNPVRSLGPAVAAGNFKGLWIYLVAPPVGALAGAATYSVVKLSDRPQNQVHDDSSRVDAPSASPYQSSSNIQDHNII